MRLALVIAAALCAAVAIAMSVPALDEDGFFSDGHARPLPHGSLYAERERVAPNGPRNPFAYARQRLLERRGFRDTPRTFLHQIGPRTSLAEILSSPMSCELLLWATGNCRIDEEEEDMIGCIRRVGAANLAATLPERCRESQFFQTLLVEERESGKQPTREQVRRNLRNMARTPIYRQQVDPFNASMPPYVPPHLRPPHPYRSGPRVCNKSDSDIKGCVMHPFGFGIPRDQIVNKVSRTRIFDFLPFIPRWFPIDSNSKDYSLGIHDEFLSNIMYRHSWFALTHRRGGWDCMRHFESLAAGSVPFFADIYACGRFCMEGMPKELLRRALTMPGIEHIGYIVNPADPLDTHFAHKNPGVIDWKANAPDFSNFKSQGTINWNTFRPDVYFEIADELLEYTKKYLTTRSLVSYILETVKLEEPKHVLIISGTTYRYGIQSVIHGFYDLGICFTLTPFMPSIFKLEEQPDEEALAAAAAAAAAAAKAKEASGAADQATASPPSTATAAQTSAGAASTTAGAKSTSPQSQSPPPPPPPAADWDDEAVDLDGLAASVRTAKHRTSLPLLEEELEARRMQFERWQGLLYMYGLRMTGRNAANGAAHCPFDPAREARALRDRIKDGEFDLVVYPWTVHEETLAQKPYWGVVSASMPRDRIIFMDSTDDAYPDPTPMLKEYCATGAHIFRRELKDIEC